MRVERVVLNALVNAALPPDFRRTARKRLLAFGNRHRLRRSRSTSLVSFSFLHEDLNYSFRFSSHAGL